ncbi:MAG: EAL domain-containing protein, partial [Actinomycetota bacterium]|nr:EAL domain-containing protein [Actinomycetota bacterium]
IHGYKRRGFSRAWITVEGLAMLLVCLAIDTPLHVLGLVYNGLIFRSLYGSRVDAAGVFLAYAGTFFGAVVLSPSLGGPSVPIQGLLIHVFNLTLLCGTFYFLGSIVKRHERTLTREEILRRAGAALVATQDRDSVYEAALEAALDLTKSAPNVRVGLTSGSREGMTVVAAAGYRASEIEGDSLKLDAMPEDISARFLQNHPVEVERSEAIYLRKDLGLSSVTRPFFLIPLFVEEELRGALGVTSDAPLAPEIKEGLIALSFQVALALEGVAFAEDRHWRQSEVRFRSLIQNSSDIVMIFGADGTINYTSPSVQRILGYDPEDLIGQPNFDLVHPDDRAGVRLFHADHVSRPDNSPTLEARLRHADGSWRHFEGAGSNLLDDPDVGGIVVNLRDVTERKQAEEALRESESALLAAQRIASVGNWSFDVVENRAHWSDEMYRIFGLASRERLTFKGFLYHVHPGDRRHILEAAREALRGEGRPSLDYRAVRPAGEVRYVHAQYEVERDASGRATLLVGTLQDITELRQKEEELRQSEERFRSLVQNSLDVITVVDARGTIQYYSPSAETVMGFKPEEFIGKNALEDVQIHPEDLPRMLDIFGYLVENPGVNYAMELRMRHADGSWRVIEATANNLLDDPSVNGIVINSRDVTERKAFEEQLSHRAFHDPLTDLPNRALFTDRLGHALARADRHPESVAVLFVDLDNFKVINDSLGHKAGDELLVATTERLRHCLRPGDTVARLSGDEFTVLLEDMADRKEAIRLAERIAERMGEPFVLRGREAFTTTSIGIAFATSSADRPDDLLRKADIAMYRAKSRGKAGYMVFDPGMDEEVHRRLRMESDLRRAIEREEFVLHYQIKVELGTNPQRHIRAVGNPASVASEGGPRVLDVEALARWQHPDRGLLMPAEFIPLAEETGLIIPMGRQILEMACRQVREWQQQSADRALHKVCVNLSGRQFQDPRLADEIREVLRDSQMDPGTLVLEITETVLMEDIKAAIVTLRQLKDLGVKLTIDDFGMGYSSLSYLKSFPVDFLKIDRSFVETLESDPANQTIVAATIDLAHALGMRVVAEGVETAGQLERLKAMGCDMAQGYYFSKPLSSEAIPPLLCSNLGDGAALENDR